MKGKEGVLPLQLQSYLPIQPVREKGRFKLTAIKTIFFCQSLYYE